MAAANPLESVAVLVMVKRREEKHSFFKKKEQKTFVKLGRAGFTATGPE
jgi:hypothetical protein